MQDGRIQSFDWANTFGRKTGMQRQRQFPNYLEKFKEVKLSPKKALVRNRSAGKKEAKNMNSIRVHADEEIYRPAKAKTSVFDSLLDKADLDKIKQNNLLNSAEKKQKKLPRETKNLLENFDVGDTPLEKKRSRKKAPMITVT
jgi:hypothetical protein